MEYRMGITLREEETILQIINEVGNVPHRQLSPELEQLIRQGQLDLEAEYESQAHQRMTENRMGFNFDELEEELHLKDQPSVPEELPPLPKEEPNELILFEQETLNKTKRTEQQIMELDQSFPKLNYTGMVGKPQDILNISGVPAGLWAKRHDNLISTAVVCIVNEKRWILLVKGEELAIFMGEEPQPTILKMKSPIAALSVSPCRKYIGVSAGSLLSIYEIKKFSSVVLLKHFPDLQVSTIDKLLLYEGVGPKLCLVDEKRLTYQILVEVGLILTKIKIEVIKHQLDRIDSLDVVRVDAKTALLAIGGAGAFHLAKIQPEITFYHKVIAQDKVTVSWRRLKDKISLLVASDSKLRIYRLVFFPSENVYSLDQHLLFVNYYPIDTMVRLSPYHYLLQSQTNFSIVALPLIPSVIEGPELTLSEAGLVSSFDRESNKIIYGCDEGTLLWWKGQIQCGNLKGLEEQVDELMIQKCAFREAFSLLVLVSKGINYSFSFTYEPQDLKRVIRSAVQISTQALVPSLDERIVLFRVGWVVQLCLECGEQKYMWAYFYQNLKERHLQKHLFNMIQVFILKGQLKSVPENIFLQIISFYSEKGKEGVIQKLVLSNREQYEASQLLSILNQREMNYLQFYLFSRAIISDQHDFYTPFIRAFSSFVKNQESQNPNVKESALLCFWILSKTFNFQHVPSGQMTRDIKIQVVTSFFLQTLSKTLIRRLSDYDLKLYLECYLVPFLNSQFKEILIQEEQQVMANFKEFDTTGEITKQSEFINGFLNYLEYCSPIIKVSSLFAEYYCTVLFLSKSQLNFERVIELLSSLFEKKFYHYHLRAFVGTRPPVKVLKQYLLNIIKKDLQKRSDRLYIKKLLAYEDREVSHLLYKIDKNYQTALQKYLGNFDVPGIFQFLEEILKEIQEMKQDEILNKERKKNEVRGFILKNIGLLFRTDNEKALSICYLVGQSTEKIHQIMFKNLFWDRERILFLTAALKHYENEDFPQRQQYLLEHLEEVCLLPEPEMRTYLNSFFYPLDSAIKVADKKNNYLAMAIFQMRSGHIEQAFTSYEKLIQTTLVNNKEEEQTKQKISYYVEECIEICKHYSGQILNENLWVRLIKFLSSFVASEHRYKVSLKVQLEKCTQTIINEMLRFLNTTLLIAFFTAPSLPLPLYKLIVIYDELFRMVKFDRSTIERSILIALKNILENRQQLAAQTVPMCVFSIRELQQVTYAIFVQENWKNSISVLPIPVDMFFTNCAMRIDRCASAVAMNLKIAYVIMEIVFSLQDNEQKERRKQRYRFLKTKRNQEKRTPKRHYRGKQKSSSALDSQKKVKTLRFLSQFDQ